MPATDPNTAAKTWLVTGCSTGLGRALARRVLERGHRCVVTARDPAQVAELVAAHPGSARAVALDVNDAAQREQAVQCAEQVFGGLDVLVNNAGYGYSSAIEEGEDAPIRAMFEANFFSVAALTRRVLPAMRARRRGHVINVSSVGGVVANPGFGYYGASKFAVEGLSLTLAQEVAPWGIKVTLVEPGPFRTDFHGRSVHAVSAPLDDYAATIGARRAKAKARSGRQPGDPVRAADAIVTVAEHPDPPLHLLLGKLAVDFARDELTRFLRSIDEWEALSLSADFPRE